MAALCSIRQPSVEIDGRLLPLFACSLRRCYFAAPFLQIGDLPDIAAMKRKVAVLLQKAAPKAFVRFPVRDSEMEQKSTNHNSPNSPPVNAGMKGRDNYIGNEFAFKNQSGHRSRKCQRVGWVISSNQRSDTFLMRP